MERVFGEERIGYAPRDPFGGGAESSPFRNSDVDFQDVFGGPPKRFSFYESRRSLAESVDLCRRESGGREDSVESRRSRQQSGEKPVFASSSSRRRQLGDDFYNDILQSSESACSSPRRCDRDPFLSSPASRVLSPNRPTQLWCESLFGGSSLPAQLRIPSKLARSMDHAAPGTPTQHSLYKRDDGLSDSFSSPSSPIASSVATRSVIGLGELKNDGPFSNFQSPLSCLIPHSYEGWPKLTEFSRPANENQIEKSSSSLEAYIGIDQFHFSIYKWAGKGVMLVMPSDSKERNEYDGRLGRLPEIIVQEVELPPPFEYSSTMSEAFKNGTVTEENKPAYVIFAGRNENDYASIIAKEFFLADSNCKLIRDDMNSKSDQCEDLTKEVLAPGADQNSETNIIQEERNPEPDIIMHGQQNPEFKSLNQLFDDDMGRQKNDDKTGQVEDKDALSIGRRKQQFRRGKRPSYAEESSANRHDVPKFSEDKSQGSKVKGKVKEFMKIFNHEASPKRKVVFDMLDRKSRGKENRLPKVDEQIHSSAVKVDELQEKIVNNVSIFDIPKTMENQVQKAEEDNSSIISDDHLINDLSFKERNEILHPLTEPSPEVPENAASSEEFVQEDVEGYLVQQLPSNQTESVQTCSQQDQIKNLDSKIREWSKEREGNIRSLLSTLQYILWPESGWKQVPLVDIIEGPSVKKAYQRALLCLHPDKLQQKGTSSNQKYIAAKVFGVLQEAWDHFNSISQF